MTTHNEIKHHMALAFFASAWADQCEECGQAWVMSGQEILSIMPEEIDPAALHAANILTMGLASANPKVRMGEVPFALDLLFAVAVAAHERATDASANESGDRDLTPEMFGHYLAMQAMGTGVGLESFGRHVCDAIAVPDCEFGSYSLERDYFKPTEWGDE